MSVYVGMEDSPLISPLAWGKKLLGLLIVLQLVLSLLPDDQMTKRKRYGGRGGPWWAMVVHDDAPIIFLAGLTSLLRSGDVNPGTKALSQSPSNGGRVEGGEVCGGASLWKEWSCC